MVYSPEMVTLLQQLRSRIFAEFGTRIRLADPELLTAVGELGKKSRDPFTRKTVIEIMKLGGIPFQIEVQGSATAAPSRDPQSIEMTYRGAKILRDKASDPSAGNALPADRQSRQMYRGQVVYK
ncbi:hypothetical protein AB4876_14840 [Zhongshania guokunii]|uniref:Uncharacterized protein n=1 Tax=Zhongshania guokunii TaxID=641783 RepID=A0ABV3UBD5_9GAMM